MRDRDYGWTVEMQIKAAQQHLRIDEVPADYRRRIGQSKISGTLKGVIGAGTKILGTIFLAAIRRNPNPPTKTSSKSANEQLIVLTRYPTPGKTKTRLIPALGEQGAADLHAAMVEHTLRWARRLRDRRPSATVQVRCDGGDSDQLRTWLGDDLDVQPQGDGDLGQRMARAADDAFAEGTSAVVMIGTDCPDLTETLATQAFDALGDNRSLVLGPANDGGYYLIGLRRMVPELFADIAWGTDKVLNQTLAIAAQRNLSVTLLTTLNDVDRPEDLAVWQRVAG